LAQEFADFYILTHHLFTLSIPPTWWSGSMLSSVTSIRLTYRVAQKSKALPNDQNIVLNCIKACQ